MKRSQIVENADSLTIGSDPEALWYDRTSGLEVRPLQLAELDFANMSMSGPLGADGESGSSWLAELRPEPSSSPMGHVKEISRLIDQVEEIHRNTLGVVSLVSTSRRRPIGGHIHFGHTTLCENVDLCRACTDNLNYWLLPLTLPLFDKLSFHGRLNNYGNPEDEPFRMQNWGFEYRVLPSWIQSEAIAQGVLTLAYVIVKLTIGGKLIIRNRKRDRNYVARICHTYSEDSPDFFRFLDVRQDNIHTFLKHTETDHYFKEIAAFIAELPTHAKMPHFDVLKGWGRAVIPLDNISTKQYAVSKRLGTTRPEPRIHWDKRVRKNGAVYAYPLVDLNTSINVPDDISGEEVLSPASVKAIIKQAKKEAKKHGLWFRIQDRQKAEVMKLSQKWSNDFAAGEVPEHFVKRYSADDIKYLKNKAQAIKLDFYRDAINAIENGDMGSAKLRKMREQYKKLYQTDRAIYFSTAAGSINVSTWDADILGLAGEV